MRKPEQYARFKTDSCTVCGSGESTFCPLDPDHVKTLGSGGKNESWNIMTLCRAHHTEKGWKGISVMAEKYPSYKNWLIKNGWEKLELNNKWFRPLEALSE